jgi:acylphosphatase
MISQSDLLPIITATIGSAIDVSLLWLTADDNRSCAFDGALPELELAACGGDHQHVPPVQYDIIFTGRVQGVGFRATTVSVAQGFAISGWVRNEPDGSVRCVAAGEAVELDRFVDSVKQAMAGYVQEACIRKGPATDLLTGFHVRY